jgi:hypothetical protein
MSMERRVQEYPEYWIGRGPMPQLLFYADLVVGKEPASEVRPKASNNKVP